MEIEIGPCYILVLCILNTRLSRRRDGQPGDSWSPPECVWPRWLSHAFGSPVSWTAVLEPLGTPSRFLAGMSSAGTPCVRFVSDCIQDHPPARARVLRNQLKSGVFWKLLPACPRSWTSKPVGAHAPPPPPAPLIISWHSWICPYSLLKGLYYFHIDSLVKTNLLYYYPLTDSTVRPIPPHSPLWQTLCVVVQRPTSRVPTPPSKQPHLHSLPPSLFFLAFYRCPSFIPSLASPLVLSCDLK